MITTAASTIWITLPITCPVRTDTRAMAMVRNRATMPSVMSVATDTAVPVAAVPMVIISTPGTR